MPAVAEPIRSSDGTVSASSIRKATDDHPRRRLAGLEEVHEEDIPEITGRPHHQDCKLSRVSVVSDVTRSQHGSQDVSGRKKPSDASITNFDCVWENDRRLSEAGVRRTSDASIVLTEDTDSFIIGDRIWVGGTKPGQIAYIGDTQFAPGEWAGVVLDEPVGKNDGSVAGIRYFQCEPKRGVFSRLTRLTREPLNQVESISKSGDVPPQPTPTNGSSGLSSSRRSLVSPAGSTKDLVIKKPPTSPLNVSALSVSSSSHPPSDLKVGERVIVMSSMGSKAGILRYIGATEFAAGEWCGVELDDPLGKNDGSVGNKRYFECQPKFGLFAPSYKVSRSPSSHRPSCMVHRNSSSSVSSSVIRRAGSRESVTSVASSAASSVRGARVRLGVTSLGKTQQKPGIRSVSTPTSSKSSVQDILREKDLQIDKLMKERDLERLEMTRAASQVDEAEQKLTSLKKEFETYRDQSEAKIKGIETTLAQLQHDKSDLFSQLEDEKKKYEDLLFQFEETRITKGEIEITHAAQEDNIRQLEQRLLEEQHKTEMLELDSNKLFEAEEALARCREDLDHLRKELQEAQRLHAEHTEKGNLVLNAEVEKLKIQVEEEHHNVEIFKEKAEKLDAEYEKQLKNVQTMLQAEKKSIEEALNVKISETWTALKLKSEELAKVELSSKENLLQLENVQKLLADTQNSLKQKTEELEKQVLVANEMECNLRKEIENTLEKLKEKQEEAERLAAKYTEEIAERNSITQQTEERNKEREMEIQKLTNEMNKLREEFSAASLQSQQTHEKELEAKTTELSNLKIQMEELSAEWKKLKSETANQKCDLEIKEELVKKQQGDIAGLSIKLTNMEHSVAALTLDLNNSKLLIGDLERQLQGVKEKCEQMSQQKQKLEDDISVLMSSSSDSSAQLTKLNTELRERERELDDAKELLSLAQQEKENVHHKLLLAVEMNNEFKQNLEKLKIDNGEMEKNLQEKVLELQEQEKKFHLKEEMLQQNLEMAEEKYKELEKESKDKIQEMTTCSQLLQERLSNEVKENEQVRQKLEQKIGDLLKEGSQKEETLMIQLKEINEKLLRAEAELTEKSSQIKKTEEELKKVVQESEEVCKEETNLKEKHSKQVESLRKEIKIIEACVEQKDAFLASINEKLQKVEKEKCNMEKLLAEADLKFNEIIDDHAKLRKDASTIEERLGYVAQKTDASAAKLLDLEKEKQSVEEICKEKHRELSVAQEELLRTQNEKVCIEAELSQHKERVTELVKEVEHLKETLSKSEVLAKEQSGEVSKLAEEVSDLHHKYGNTANLLEESRSHLNNALKEIEKVTAEKAAVDKVLAERNAKVTSLTLDVERLEDDFKKHREDLQRKLEQSQKEAAAVQELHNTLMMEKLRIDELQEKLHMTETERNCLVERCQMLETSVEGASDLMLQLAALQTKLNEVQEREKEIIENNRREKAALENTLELKSFDLAQKEEELVKQKAEISMLLQNKTQSEECSKILLGKLQTEKKQLEEKVLEMQRAVTQPQGNADGEDSTYIKLLEEREFAQGQIDFLNSVIVEKQRKNEELIARIEMLELGFTPNDTKELLLDGISPKSVAPRLYCDICDMFDTHDTEDCPRQATESPPPNPTKHNPGTRSGIRERPYCDLCEVFGHTTEACDESETF